jgi:hypothetical protein
VKATEKDSLLKDLIESGAAFPVCYFSVDTGVDTLQVSLDVVAEAEVTPNKYKTTCSVWKDKLYAELPADKTKESQVIAKLTQEIVASFARDWKIANQKDSQELFFRIRTFKEF